MLKWTYFAAVTLLLGLVSFALAASVGVALTVLWAIVAGLASLLFVRLIDAHAGDGLSELGPMLMAGTALALGGGLKWLTGAPTTGVHDALVVLLGMGAAWGLDAALATGRGRSCFVCKLPMGAEPAFACPRCHQTVCARPTCWIARHFRCRYCDEREVIVFPIDERWWKTRVGARAGAGACSSCYKEANEADLRECGQCRWPMCKRCWDYHNGACAHCGWVMPDLPPALQPFMTAAPDVRGGYVEPAARRRP